MTFEPSIEYQRFKITVEPHLTKKEFSIILENFKFFKMSNDEILEILFIPYPIPKMSKPPSKYLYSSFSEKFSNVQNSA